MYLVHILRKNNNVTETEDDEKAIPPEIHGGSIQEANNEHEKTEEESKIEMVSDEPTSKSEMRTMSDEPTSKSEMKTVSDEPISKRSTSHKHSNRVFARDAKGRFVKSKNI